MVLPLINLSPLLCGRTMVSLLNSQQSYWFIVSYLTSIGNPPVYQWWVFFFFSFPVKTTETKNSTQTILPCISNPNAEMCERSNFFLTSLTYSVLNISFKSSKVRACTLFSEMKERHWGFYTSLFFHLWKCPGLTTLWRFLPKQHGKIFHSIWAMLTPLFQKGPTVTEVFTPFCSSHA